MTLREQTIAVKHNIEVAHRLFELPGKCEQIHGHSMWVTMELSGKVNDKGILGGIEYGDLKNIFRTHLDEEYDHRLLLNVADPFAHPIYPVEIDNDNAPWVDNSKQIFLPGLQSTLGDPTTENISFWIANAMQVKLANHDMVGLFEMKVTVWETSVNMALTRIGLIAR